MRWTKISKAVIRRLPVYLRILDEVAEDTQLISSQELADRAGVGSALVRKDLAWFEMCIRDRCGGLPRFELSCQLLRLRFCAGQGRVGSGRGT